MALKVVRANRKLSNSLQGGNDNPGHIPLQNSGRGGKGYTANLQPAQQIQGALTRLVSLKKKKKARSR